MSKHDKTDWERTDDMSDAELRRAAESDPDNPLLTEDELKRLRPAREVGPELVVAYGRGDLRRSRGP